MTLADDIDFFSRVTLFDGFPDEQLRMLAFGSRRMFLRGGELLFQEGDPSDGGHVVVSGQIDLTVMAGNREKILSSQLAGSLIGEAALIVQSRRVANAIARSNSELIHIPRELFLRMLREYPQLAAILHRRLAQSVKGMMGEMDAVGGRMRSIAELSRDGLED